MKVKGSIGLLCQTVAASLLGLIAFSCVSFAELVIVDTIKTKGLISDLALNPIINHIYTANNDGTVSVIDGSSNSVVDTIYVGGERHSHYIAVNPNTNRIYVVNFTSDVVSVINGLTNEIEDTVVVGNKPYKMAANPTTNLIYVTHIGVMDWVSIIDGSNNTVTDSVHISWGVYGVVVDPSVNRIYVGAIGGIYVIDGSNNTVIATIDPLIVASPHGMAINPQSHRIYVISDLTVPPPPDGVQRSRRGRISIIDGLNNSLVDTIDMEMGLDIVGANSSTNHFYVVDQEGGIFTFDEVRNTVIDTTDMPIARYIYMLVNPNTNRIYLSTGLLIYVLQEKVTVVEDGSFHTNPGNLDRFALLQNYPNPFNSETTIQYELSASCEVRLDIYNLLGQSVRSLALGEQKMGRYSVRWDGKDDRGGDVASGIYIYRLEAFTNQRQDFVESKRMLLLR